MSRPFLSISLRRLTRHKFLRPACLLLLASAAALVASGCAKKEFIPWNTAHGYIDRQSLGQLQPGWTLTAVHRDAERPYLIIHHVVVPPELAGNLLMEGSSARERRIAEVVCPPANDPIWKELHGSQDVIAEIGSENGTFEQVSCRARR